MPTTNLLGVRAKQLANDFTFFYFVVAFTQVLWFIIYVSDLAALVRPVNCDTAHNWAVFFCLLGVFLLQAILSCLAMGLSLRGTSLEPSKRRWVAPVFNAFLVSIAAALGFLCYALWAVLRIDSACWSSDRKVAVRFIISGFTWELCQPLGIYMIYLQLSDVDPDDWWHSVTRKGTGYGIHFWTNWVQPHRGPLGPYEEMASWLQRLMAGADLDKTDVVSAVACVGLLQDEAFAADAASAASTVPDDVAAPKKAQAAAGSAGEHQQQKQQHAAVMSWAAGVVRGVAANTAASEAAEMLPAAEAEALAEALYWSRFAAAAYGRRQASWCRGQVGHFETQRRLKAAVKAARATGQRPLAGWDYAPLSADGKGKGKGGGCCATAPGKAEAAGAPPSQAVLQDFVAAQMLLADEGVSGGDGGKQSDAAAATAAAAQTEIVHLCPGSAASGLLPHIIALDRERQAVVLGIAGVWEPPHLTGTVGPLPAEWMAAAAAGGGDADATHTTTGATSGSTGSASAGGGSTGSSSSSSWVHTASLTAAQQVWERLEDSQVLRRLLLAAPVKASAGGTAAASAAALPDCRGWRLVLVGHDLGAGAAALLALRIKAWHPALSVWAVGAPAQLCSPDLGAELAGACTLTSLVVGHDFVPRASLAARYAVAAQAMVGLARLRYSKTGLQLALLLEGAFPKRFKGRWLCPERALRPLGDIHAEALPYLEGFRQWQEQQERESPAPPATLSGKVLLLARLRPPPPPLPPAVDDAKGEHTLAKAAVAVEEDGGGKLDVEDGKANGLDGGGAAGAAGGPKGSNPAPPAISSSWRACWVSGEAVRDGGIRISRHTVTDHWVSRLMALLTDLAAASAAGAGEGGAPPAEAPAVTLGADV